MMAKLISSCVLSLLFFPNTGFSQSFSFYVNPQFEKGLSVGHVEEMIGFQSKSGQRQAEVVLVSFDVLPHIQFASGIGISHYNTNYKNAINGKRLLTQQNRFDIPVLLQYHSGKNKKISFYTGVGMQFSFHLNGDFIILDRDNNLKSNVKTHLPG